MQAVVVRVREDGDLDELEGAAGEVQDDENYEPLTARYAAAL